MRPTQPLHAFISFFVKDKLETESLGNGLVGYVVMPAFQSVPVSRSCSKVGGRWTYSPAGSELAIQSEARLLEEGRVPRHHEVIAIAHSSNCLDDICFVIRDDLDFPKILQPT